MVNNKNAGQKGFSGLSHLVSDISSRSDMGLATDNKTARSTNTAAQAVSRDLNTGPGNPPDSLNFVKWFVAIMIITFLSVILVSSNNAKQRYYPTSSAETNVPSANKNQTVPSHNENNNTHHSKLNYVIPPPRKDHILTESEISWCLREKIRLETIRNIVDSSSY
jgi:hypothetical protein